MAWAKRNKESLRENMAYNKNGKKTDRNPNHVQKENQIKSNYTIWQKNIYLEYVRKHRPGFDRYNFATNWHIFLHINWSIYRMIPNGRIIGAINHIDLYFDRTW